MQSLRHSPVISLFAALLLAVTSLSPFWAGGRAEAAAPDRIEHAAHHQDAADLAAPVEAAGAGVCQQHDVCSGQCCAGCAHCVVTLPGLPGFALRTLTEFHAAVLRLTLDGSVSSPDRPPRG
jgi:hypothetical protein